MPERWDEAEAAAGAPGAAGLPPALLEHPAASSAGENWVSRISCRSPGEVKKPFTAFLHAYNPRAGKHIPWV